jgi:hypothetical protein
MQGERTFAINALPRVTNEVIEAIENVRVAIQGCLAARKANDLPMAVEVREDEVVVA